MTSTLPPPYVSRGLTTDDIDAVFALTARCETELLGEPLVERADIEGDWARPSFDLATQAVGVTRDDALVAYVEVYAERAEAYVSPDHGGRGIGSWLADQARDIARRAGRPRVGQTVLAGSPAERFFVDRAYDVGWTSWVLRLDPDDRISEQPLPPGVVVRDCTDDEVRAAFGVIEDAFNEWPDRQPSTFDDWDANATRRSGFAPEHLRVAVDGGDVVGVCLWMPNPPWAFVDQLAVRHDQRGRGIARALLADAYTLGRAAGCPRGEVSTDSRTGALELYEKIGMRVAMTWRHYRTGVEGDR